MERQQVLCRTESFKAIFIVDEAVLHHRVGGTAVLVRQLTKLQEVSHRDNVEIRAIPYREGAHLGLWGAFVVLEFAAPADNDLAFVEHQAGEMIIANDASRVAPYLERFWNLEACSLSIDDTRSLISDAIRQHAG